MDKAKTQPSNKKKWNKDAPNKPLTPKERKFLSKYLSNNFNGTKAAMHAGYSEESAAVTSSNLLRKPNIKAKFEEAFKDNGIIIEKSMQELAKIAHSDIKDFIEIDDLTGVVKVKPLKDIPEGMTSVIHSIEEDRAIKENSDGTTATVYDKFKFKLHDKLKANELILKMAGKFTDKIDINANLNIDIKPTRVIFVDKDGKEKGTKND